MSFFKGLELTEYKRAQPAAIIDKVDKTLIIAPVAHIEFNMIVAVSCTIRSLEDLLGNYLKKEEIEIPRDCIPKMYAIHNLDYFLKVFVKPEKFFYKFLFENLKESFPNIKDLKLKWVFSIDLHLQVKIILKSGNIQRRMYNFPESTGTISPYPINRKYSPVITLKSIPKINLYENQINRYPI